MKPLKENFTLLEAAVVCGLSITTVKKVIRSGYLEAYQCGGELRVTWFDLFAFALSYGRVADRSRV